MPRKEGELMNDRVVHGVTADGGEIVRYDRAGKWYVEWDSHRPRRAVSVASAAALATMPGAKAYPGRDGGARFSKIVRDRS